MDLHEIKKRFDLYGYAVIPGVFDADETDAIRKLAYENLKLAEKRNALQKRGSKPALMFWPQDYSGLLRMFAKDDRLVAIVKHFLGDDVVQLNNQIYFREAGDGDQFAWHQDICFRTPPEVFNQIETGYLQTIIAVDDITEENAPIEFIPGSHTWGDLNLIPRDNTEDGLREFKRGDWLGERLLAKAGDVLIWSVMTVHGSEQNVSQQNRMTYMNGFARADSVKSKEFPVYLRDGEVA